ncbi:MAG: preprotein translocase subunit SecE [Clostridia bacterium]|nr:preprotein translocase subunit SecE [Clostridia bacterium]
MADNTTKLGFGGRIKKFFKDYKAEFKKIKWPTMLETNKSYVIVLIITAIAGLAIFGFDYGLRELLNLIAG